MPVEQIEEKAGSRPWWALALAAAALVALAAVLVAPRSADPAAEGEPASAEMLAVSPGGEVQLTELTDNLASLYRAADADREAFASVTCYCGCVEFLDHRQLLDCFVRPGGGWERHAVGCAVCQDEARDVIDLRAQDVPLADISRRIDDRYGAMAPTA
jgi:hypothetical protein